MIETKSFLAQALFKSSLPLLIGGSYHLLEQLCLNFFQDAPNQKLNGYNINKTLLEAQLNGSEDIKSDYLSLLNQISFGIYTNFFAFLLTMVLFDLFHGMVKTGICNFWRKVKPSSRSRGDCIEKQQRPFNLISENQIIRILFYVLIFISLQIVGLGWDLLAESEPLTSIHHPAQVTESFPDIKMMLNNQYDNDDVSRILEEQEEVTNEPQSLSMTSDKISLSMGNILSSLSLTVNAMVLSKDKKIAFATVDYYGSLQIIDISDLKSPFVLGSLNLEVSTFLYRIKSLILSSDEKTLYLSNSRDLEIVDITDLTSPKLISLTKSKIIGLDNSYNDGSVYFKTSLAVSESTKTLYIGGLGLQVYDISDPNKPALLQALRNDIDSKRRVSINEICLSRDGKVLFLVNGTLDIYNISNPKEMKRFYSLKTESSLRSIMLSEDFKTAFLLGTSMRTKKVVFEEVDISTYESLKIKNTIDLGYNGTINPRFLAISPSKSKFFIFTDSFYGGSELLIFDRIKQRAIKNENSLIQDLFTMDFALDGKTLITGSNSAFMTVELFLEYPNNQIFSISQNNLINKISLPTEFKSMKISNDGRYLFILRIKGENEFDFNTFEIFDLQNPSGPTVLGSLNCGSQIRKMHFTKDEDTAYLISDSSILVLDITNSSSISLKKSYKVPNQGQMVKDFTVSADEKTGFLIRSIAVTGFVSFIDLSKPSEMMEDFVNLEIKSTIYNSKLILMDDGKTLMVINKEITIYNISNLSSPVQILSLPFEPSPYLNSYLLSPDQKTLYIEGTENTGFNKLRIYDLSNSTSPQLVSEKYFSKNEELNLRPGFSLSPDSKTGFIFQEDSLIKINMTNLKQPRVVGVIPLLRNDDRGMIEYALSADGQTIYAGLGNEIRILNINPQYTLFLKQEKFQLGEKYSDSIAVLNLTESYTDYNLVATESYRVIKLSLLDIKVAPNKPNFEITNSPLPPWMTFDRGSNTLTVESKKQRDIGTYILHSSLSLKIPREAFNNTGTKENPVSSEDLVAWLIGLDYVDPQLYLTANFPSFETFYLPSNFTVHRREIYKLLKKYHVETCTEFEIASSLKLENKSLAVSSLSTNNIKVEIKLEPGHGVDAKFVTRPYGVLMPLMKDNKTKVSLEGNLKEINTAINSIVVNFENGTSCDANVMINDGFNPPILTGLNNISRYFAVNRAPYLNKHAEKTIQEQINSARVQTGVSFTFTFSEDSFEDDFAESLDYDFVMAKNGTAPPSWLDFNGLTLKGSPPEEIFGRDLEMVLIVKNEFKQYEVPFKLHTNISIVFWLKLVMRYSPYILTLIGLLVSANKIFNILRKGFYKHLKEFYIGVGEEISENVIFPISFVKEERNQSQLILKQLGNMNVTDFIDQERNNIAKEKIISKIRETVQNMSVDIKEQITLHPSPIIDQIIINKFIWKQLYSKHEIKTKHLFEDLKPYWLEVVERDVSGFTININKFNKLIKRIQKSSPESNESFTLEESLIIHDPIMPGVNIHLLKDAVLAFAFENHSIDMSPIDVDIGVKQKVPKSFLFRFLKLDLKDIYLDYKTKMNYGINYQIMDDRLCFYGIAQNYFKGKTIAIQIKNRKHKIMKEIWIRGVSSDFQKDEIFMLRDEQEMRGQGYEIY